MTGYEEILDQDDINELLTLRDSTTGAQFRVGDITNKYVEKRGVYGVTKAHVYSAIGSYYGKQARTIRSYAYVSDFYPPQVREQYPILSFDHFKVAMRAENPYEVLEWAIGSLDGRPQTVDSCIAEFAIKVSEPESLESMFQPIRRYIVNLPGFLRERVEHLLDQIEELIKEGAVV